MTNNYDIFISYSRTDLERVKAIKIELEQSTGALCWMDLEGIESGEQFENVIITAINCSDTMLFMLSENSMRSEWALDELDFAKKKRKRIVILHLEEVELSDRFYFRYHKYDQIKWQIKPQHDKLIRDICQWIGIATNGSVIEQKNEKFGEFERRNIHLIEDIDVKDSVQIIRDCDNTDEDILQKLGLSKKSKGANARKHSIFEFEIIIDSVEDNWDMFIDAIIRKQVVPVVGPGFIRVGNESFVQSFIERIAKALGIDNCKITSLNQLAFHENFFKYGRNNVHSLLSRTLFQYEKLVEKRVNIDIFLRLMSTHYFPFVLTTTIDGMLEKKMREFYGHNLSVLMFDNDPRHNASSGDIRNGSDILKPTLYYMYGKASNSNRFVVTNDDLRSFSKSWLSEASAPRRLRNALQEHYLLFLGYDYKNGIDSFFLQDLRLSGDSITHPKPIFEFIQLIEKGIEQYPDVIVNEIIRRIEEKDKERIITKFDSPQHDCDVYISYHHSDREIADKLYDTLTKLGLQVWYDKKNLSIGSDFLDEIRNAIRTARYFVPILTQNVLEDKSGPRMYRREWNEASELAKCMGRYFIIPIVEKDFDLNEFAIPDEMQYIHPIYYSEDSNFKDVAENFINIYYRTLN